MSLKNNSGQSLFELVVTIGVIGIALIATTALIVNSINNSTFSRNKSVASHHTQEALEWIRGQRDTDWAAFITHASPGSGKTYCLDALDAAFSNTGSCGQSDFVNGNTPFLREVTLIYNPGPPDTIEATVVTKWESSNKEHQVRASTVFSNWKAD
jgi:type II secretory pathway pseudopilin PulG